MVTPPEEHDQVSLDRKLNAFIDEQRQANANLSEFIRRTDSRYNTISEELSTLKGGYAVNTALSSAPRIANDLGYQFVSQVPWQEISAFANLAAAAEESENEVQSFRNADMVLLVQDSYGQPHYLALEVSYRVAADDIRRAKRNADYLQRFTTMPSLGAVVGVIVTQSVQHEADDNNVKWHRIRPT